MVAGAPFPPSLGFYSHPDRIQSLFDFLYEYKLKPVSGDLPFLENVDENGFVG